MFLDLCMGISILLHTITYQSQEQIHLQMHSAHMVELYSVSSGLSSNSRHTGQVKFSFWPTSGLMSLLKLLGKKNIPKNYAINSLQ